MFSVFFSLFAVFILQTQVFGFSFKGSRITDLEYNDPNFIQEAHSWDILSTTDDYGDKNYTICAKTYFLGGYAALLPWDSVFVRTYTNLPPHNMIYFSFNISVFGEGEKLLTLVLMLEKSPMVVLLPLEHPRLIHESDCSASSLNEFKKVNIYGRTKHTNSALRFIIQPQVETMELTKVFGFRDFIFHFQNVSNTDKLQENEFCMTLDSSDVYPICDCPQGQYKSPEGSCQLCHSSCKTCFGPSSSECFDCKDLSLFDGNECRTCHESCATCFGPSENECLTCFNGYYMFEGSSCIATCNSPFIATNIGAINYCSFPCPSDEFLYPNGECRVSCDTKFNSMIWSNRKLCSYYCSHQEEYYHPGSNVCLFDCGPGFYKNVTARYCVPCQDNFCSSCSTNNGAYCQECKTGAILDLNGVCKECRSLLVTYVKPLDTGHRYTIKIVPKTCDLGRTVIQNALTGKSDPKTLDFPSFSFFVSSKGNEYVLDLLLEGSTLQETKLEISLYHLNGYLIVPKKIVPSQELQEINKYVPITKAIFTTVLTVSFAGSAILGSTACIWSIIGFQQFVGYFIYINIELPYQVRMLLSLFSFSTWDFLPNPINTLTEPLLEDMLKEPDNDTQLPQKFVENDMTTSFIENAGGSIAMNFALIMLLVCIIILIKLKTFKNNRILKALRKLLKWNIITRTYLESAIPLILAVILQLYSLKFDHTYFLISSILSIVSLIYLTSFLTLAGRYLYKQPINELKKRHSIESYGTLWEGIILIGPSSKFYHIIILLRGFLLIFLIGFLESIPLLQIVPLIAYNVALIFYLFKEASFEDHYLNVINRVKEILILIGEMFILGLYFKGGSEQHYNNLGWLIVFCFLSALFIETTYIIATQIMNLKKLISQVRSYWNALIGWFKNKSKKGKFEKTKTHQGSLFRDQPKLRIMELGQIEQDEDTLVQ